MTWKNAASVLEQCGIQKHKHLESRTHAATTGWGVKWDEISIARDILQNFYDANRTEVSRIKVLVHGRNVQISAPSTHDLELLFYLASTKGPDDVGQYGEGFKVAVTCLLRDHRVTPVARSGKQALCIQLSETPVPNTEHFPLVYHFFETQDVVEHTTLFLPNCSQKLIQELQKGLSHFLYDGNLLLGSKGWSSYGDDFSIYCSNDSTGGHVFYRNLRRGAIEGIPIVLVLNKEYKVIENKIKNDRDRNAFGEELLDLFYRTFARYAFSYDWQGPRIIIEAARERWSRGHPLLAAIAYSVGYREKLFSQDIVKEVFGSGFYARSTTSDSATQLRYNSLESKWQNAGKQTLPAYFARFGVLSAEAYCKEQDQRARKDSVSKGSRSPSRAERESLALLKSVLLDLAPEVMSIFEKRGVTYTVADSEVALGALQQGRGYRSPQVFLAAEVFVGEFSRAVAVFLHEHAHIFGHDGDRGFTDALTELLESVIALRNEISQYEVSWEEARTKVKKERRGVGKSKQCKGVEANLARMTETELRALIGQVPQVILKRLLREAEQTEQVSLE